jgi:hypothetical protein
MGSSSKAVELSIQPIMAALCSSFGDAIISKPSWRAHSLDLTLCDLILEDICKQRV